MHQMTKEDVIRLEIRHKVKHGVPNMIYLINYTYVAWKICPTGWKGQFTGQGDNTYNYYRSCCGL